MAAEAKIKITAQNDTDSAFKKAQGNLDSLRASVAGGMGAALGGALAAGGLASLVKNAIDAADNLRDMSQSTGIAIESLGGLGFAASQNGGSLESVASAAGKLNKSIAEAAAGSREALQPFQAIGVSVTDAAGKTKAADVVFAELADRFQNFEDGPEKSALALKLFGKAGADQIALLNEGGDALRANIEYYKRYSGVTQEVADQSDKFNDTLGKIGLIGQSLGTTMASSLLPALQAVADELLAAKENGEGFARVGDIVRTVFETVAVLAANVQFVLVSVGREIGAIAAQAVALGRLDIKGFNAISVAVKEDGVRARAELDALERRILNIAQPSAGDQTDAESRRLGLSAPKPIKTTAPRLSGLDGGKGRAEKDQISEAQRALAGYVKSLESTTEKTQELTESQKALDFLKGLGAQGEVPQVRELVLGLAERIDKEKELAEQIKFRRALSVEEGRELERQNEIYQQRLKTMLDATPSAILEKQRDDVRLLTDEYEAGRISEQQYLEAVAARLDLTNEKLKEGKGLAEDLGLSFTSAFEDAIVGGKSLGEVLKGLEQDIMRIVTRKLVTEPAGDAVTKMLKGFMTGGGSSGSNPIGNFIGSIFGGARANGGPVSPGRAYLVGERGPEIVVPRGAATVLPNGVGTGNQVNVTINQTFGQETSRSTLLQAAADARRQLEYAGRNL